MIRKEDVIAIAKRAYQAGFDDGLTGMSEKENALPFVEDMVSEALADCENYNENLN